jgi:hypothetical protein
MATYLMSFALALFVLYGCRVAFTAFLPSRRRTHHERQQARTGEKSWDITKVKSYPRDLHDVCETIFLLRQKIVPDLIPEVLDLAEYWIVTSAARASRRAEFTQSNAGRAYVIASLPDYLPVGSVRKIAFSTVSRDQGWSSFPEQHGTYENSNTWFEVVVYEPDPYELARVVTPRMRIITNVHAGKEWKKHDVVWTHDDEDEEVRLVVKGIKGGQRVALTAWAQYPGWKNNVSSASVDIYTPKVRRG